MNKTQSKSKSMDASEFHLSWKLQKAIFVFQRIKINNDQSTCDFHLSTKYFKKNDIKYLKKIKFFEWIKASAMRLS